METIFFSISSNLLCLPKAKRIDYQYNRTRFLVGTILPSELIAECGIKLQQKRPDVIELENDGPHVGAYDTLSKKVYIARDSYKRLPHEFQHFLNENGVNGPISRRCLNEITAYYLEEIERLRIENRHLKIGQ